MGGTEVRVDGGVGDGEHGLEIGVGEWVGAIKGAAGGDDNGSNRSANGIGKIEIDKRQGAASAEA